MIKVENLTYDYPGKRAIDNLNIVVEKNSITALVGPNGSGKTTLMKNILALLKPTKGKVFVDGVDVAENPKKCHEKIGYLPDFYGLDLNLTIKQALTFSLYSNKPNTKNPVLKVAETIKKLSLTEHENKKIKELSRGLYQRVAIGQAIIHNPELLILDEPASGLDPEARHELSQLLKELNKQGVTILVSSHILSELEEYCSHIIILKNGKLVDSNTLSEISYDKTLRRMVLETTTVFDGLESLLISFDKVKDLEILGKKATFIFEGEDKDKATLLQELIKKGVLISNFSQEDINIQDYYINKSKSADNE